MCSDSYPIPILSLFFLYHPYIPYFLIQKCFHFLVDTSSEEGNEKIGNCVHYFVQVLVLRIHCVPVHSIE